LTAPGSVKKLEDGDGMDGMAVMDSGGDVELGDR